MFDEVVVPATVMLPVNPLLGETVMFPYNLSVIVLEALSAGRISTYEFEDAPAATLEMASCPKLSDALNWPFTSSVYVPGSRPIERPY